MSRPAPIVSTTQALALADALADEIIRRVLPGLVRFEGIELAPYLCPAGIPTIGLGATYYLDGRAVKLTDPPITREHAFALAVAQLRRDFVPHVARLCRGARTAGELAALVDFAFNVGVGALRASTLRRRVNDGPREDVPAQFMRWTKAGGRVLRGLVLRCQHRVGLWSAG